MHGDPPDRVPPGRTEPVFAPPRIKVCGLTDPVQARWALELGADYVGVIRYERSPRQVPRARLNALLEAIPAGRRVAVDAMPSAPLLNSYRREGFDFFQIHFDPTTPLETVAAWSATVGPQRLWLAPRLPPGRRIFPRALLDFADTFVLDTYSPNVYGGTGRTGDWELLAQCIVLYQHKTWILAGGLEAGNVRQALVATGAEVVDVNSGVETSPGVKDRPLLEAFFEAAGRGPRAGQTNG